MAKKIIERCLHCGNRAAFTIAASGSQPNSVEYPTPEIITWTTWRVLLCSTCSQPTLEQDQQKSRLSSPPTIRGEAPEIIYPADRTERWSAVPPSIRDFYTQALNVANVSSRACAMLAGVILEEICRVEHVQGDTLAQRLDDLAVHLPQTLGSLIHQVRQLRNKSVHLPAEHVTEAEVAFLLACIDALIEYVYVAPKLLQYACNLNCVEETSSCL
jgi:hypothetical protein